jgi:PKD repeat protein
MAFSTAGVAWATPTIDFTFSPTTPTVNEPVTFTSTVTCDIEPCTVGWRWFRNNPQGTTMGQGETLTYAFPAAGTYTVVAKITNAGSTHGSATASHSLVVANPPETTFQDDSRQIRYDTWRGAADAAATAGGYRFVRARTASARFRFSGTAVSYVARTGPARGIARLTVADTQQLVNLYSPTPGSKSFDVTGLTDAPHRILVQPTGTKDPWSSGTTITLDVFVVGADHTDDRSSAILYNNWVGNAAPAASGGTVRASSATGAGAALAFNGTSVTWLGSTGPGHGQAEVFIDGRLVETVDGYSATQTWRVAHTYDNLVAGPHSIRIAVLGTHRIESTGNRVTVDAFTVR